MSLLDPHRRRGWLAYINLEEDPDRTAPSCTTHQPRPNELPNVRQQRPPASLAKGEGHSSFPPGMSCFSVTLAEALQVTAPGSIEDTVLTIEYQRLVSCWMSLPYTNQAIGDHSLSASSLDSLK